MTSSRAIPAVLVSAFALCVGDFGFRSYNPSLTPEYTLSGEVQPLSYYGEHDEPQKHLYLRRVLHLTESPIEAWLEVMAHDSLDVYVNGRRVARGPMVGYGRVAAQVLDITSLLHEGENTVALHAGQTVLHRPPEAAINGLCRFADGNVISLSGSADWRAANVYERRGEFWFETEFDDQHWGVPTVGEPVAWQSQVVVPPRAVTEPRRSQWITTTAASAEGAVFARDFAIAGRPREGWLRVIGTGSVRVAVNGWLTTQTEPDLGLPAGQSPREFTLDISPLLRPGYNSISVLTTGGSEAPRIRADVEATTLDGRHVYVGTDESWRGARGRLANWMQPDWESGEWTPCRAEIGYQGVVPRAMKRELLELDPPPGFWAARAIRYVAWLLAVGAGGFAGAAGASFLLSGRGATTPTAARPLPYLALLPSVVGAVVGHLMTWDIAWSPADIYHPFWLLSLLLAPVMQWLAMLMFGAARQAATRVETNDAATRSPAARLAYAAAFAVLTILALWLRLRNLTAEPIHHDEVTAYAFTDAIFKYGFPGGQVHPDIPFGYCATNELTYYFNALCALFTDDPLLIIRVPSVIFSMATFFLLAYLGWRWFDPLVGLVAAALFAVSPHSIAMADFGRYLSQTQFFTLLTMGVAYEAIRGTGPPHPKTLWASAICFIAMYLSWEGTGMFGVGLAAAALFHRRRHLGALLRSPHLYLASFTVLLAVLAQNAHRVMQQTQRIWYGEGISSLTVKPMWRFPFFDYDYFLVNAGWTRDALLPMIALGIAVLMAVGHRWRSPLRFVLICFIGNAQVMAALLPVRTNRYSYHLSQLFILIFAVVVVAGLEAAIRAVQVRSQRRPLRWYGYGVAGASLAVLVALASGWTVRTRDIERYSNSSFDIDALHVPDWDEPMRYLLANLREGDIVIAIFPHAQNYLFAAEKVGGDTPRTTDYWIQSRLILQATLGDRDSTPRDRRSGAVMLYNLEQVKELFATHDRIWYCTMRMAQSKLNDSEVSQYLRQHMDVVSEDFATALMLRDATHRSAPVRVEEDEASRMAGDYFLQ